ncbi:TPA: winged helix-turn-helix domain-containing protein [Salmonella enterica]
MKQKGLTGLMFIISHDILFDEEGGLLENQAADVSIMMAASTRRLLEILLLNQGNPVTRDTLFKMVWDDNGLRSSNSNLNQYISILRKQLGQVGLPDDTVITIPRVGFMFNPEIEVRCDNPATVTPFVRSKRTFRHFITGPLYYPVFTLSVFLICVGMFFIFFHEREPDAVTLSVLDGYPPGCDVYALSGSGVVTKKGPVSFIAENCNKGVAYFLFEHSGPSDGRLVVSCEKSRPGYFTHCDNRRDAKG